MAATQGSHHVIQTLPPSKRRTSQPYGDAEFVSLTGYELGSPAPTYHMFPATLLAPKHNHLMNCRSTFMIFQISLESVVHYWCTGWYWYIFQIYQEPVGGARLDSMLSYISLFCTMV